MADNMDYGKLAAAMIELLGVSSAKQLVLPSVEAVSDSKETRETTELAVASGLEVTTGDENSNLGSKEELADEREPMDSDTGSSDGSVILPESPSGKAKGKLNLVFGDFVNIDPTQPKHERHYATYVRHSGAKAMRRALAELCEAKIPKAAEIDIAICTYTAGTMPPAMTDGKARLRSLAAIGDAMITLALAVDCASRGKGVDALQTERSRVTSNSTLRRLLAKNDLMQYITYAAGVDPMVTAGSATAFEAVIGVLYLYRPINVVERALRNMGVLGGA